MLSASSERDVVVVFCCVWFVVCCLFCDCLFCRGWCSLFVFVLLFGLFALNSVVVMR